MGNATGRVSELRLDANGQVEVFITCNENVVPLAGQYLLALNTNDGDAVLGQAVYLVEKSRHGFWGSSSLPVTWELGTHLELIGPLGHGFTLPRVTQRLSLVALGQAVSRLMPVLAQIDPTQTRIALYTDLKLPYLPAMVEAHPLAVLKDELVWPDFFALDMPIEKLADLRQILALTDGAHLTCPAVVLITTAMPCAGMAQCGACAVPARRGWKLACEDGPVFDLSILKW